MATTERVRFYIRLKKIVFMVVVLSLLSAIINSATFIATKAYISQFVALINSDYEYSATCINSSNEDDYIFFDAGICFGISPEAKTSINADILMQSDAVDYTDSICWNANPLETNEIAITKGLARDNGLSEGSVLYSKHIVDGELKEYTVKQILPDTINATTKSNMYGSGIIIMGYDERYTENLTHKNLIFTKLSIDEVAELCGTMPENLVYRNDEIRTVLLEALPYLIIGFVLNIILIIFLVFICKREIGYNFKRQSMFGFNRKILNRSYYSCMWKITMSFAIIALLLSIFAVRILGIQTLAILISLATLLLEVVINAIVIIILNKKLWRQ